jgi:hypothetical protein
MASESNFFSKLSGRVSDKGMIAMERGHQARMFGYDLKPWANGKRLHHDTLAGLQATRNTEMATLFFSITLDCSTGKVQPLLITLSANDTKRDQDSNTTTLQSHAAIASNNTDKDYGEAESHLLVGTQESAEALGLVLFDWSELEPSHDKGAYILRGVLQELAMRNLRDANVMFQTFVERLPPSYLSTEQKVPNRTKAVQTFKSTLLNLTQLLLLACETGNPSIFKLLQAKYRPALAIDENFGSVREFKKNEHLGHFLVHFGVFLSRLTMD